MTTCQQRPQFLDLKGGRCTQVWLYSVNILSSLFSFPDFSEREKLPWNQNSDSQLSMKSGQIT